MGRRLRDRNDGTSLIELLVVVALIVILYVMLLGSSSKSNQLRQIAACANNLKNIHVALKTFAIDSQGKLPYSAAAVTAEAPLSQLVPRYTTAAAVFICPGSGDRQLPDAQPFADRRISYAYYMGRTLEEGSGQPLITDRQVDSQPKPAGALLFSADGKPPGGNHNKFGGNILFCDGAVQSSPPKAATGLTNPPGVVLLNPKP